MQKKFNAKKLVRICADNPFLLPEYILELINALDDSSKEYASFQWEDNTPVLLSHIGVFGEAMTLGFLKKIQNSTEDPLYLEHVTNYIYDNKKSVRSHILEPSKNTGGKRKYSTNSRYFRRL